MTATTTTEVQLTGGRRLRMKREGDRWRAAVKERDAGWIEGEDPALGYAIAAALNGGEPVHSGPVLEEAVRVVRYLQSVDRLGLEP